MIIKKGAVVILETPHKTESIIVRRTHSIRFVITGGTGLKNGSMLILQKHPNAKHRLYVKPADLTDVVQKDHI